MCENKEPHKLQGLNIEGIADEIVDVLVKNKMPIKALDIVINRVREKVVLRSKIL